MAIEFPNSPTEGDQFTASNGVIYTYENGGWNGNSASGLEDVFVSISGDEMTGNLTVPSLNGGQLGGFRNQIINGLASNVVNQRGFISGTASVVPFQYTVDRWRLVNTGDIFSWTNTNSHDFVFNVAGELEQVVESLAPGTYTLSWVGTATAQIAGGGIGFTPIANSGQFIVPATGFANRFDVTLRFGNGTVSYVQLEPGPVATPFEHRPIGTELALCQRYFISYSGKIFTKLMTYARISAGTGGFLQICLPVPMRVVPSVPRFDDLRLVNGFPCPPSGIKNIHSIHNVVSIDYDDGEDSVALYGISFLQPFSDIARLSFDAEL